jgi:hypothetical protein
MNEITSEPLTPETLDYVLLAAEYGTPAAYQRYLELLAEVIENGAQSVEE